MRSAMTTSMSSPPSAVSPEHLEDVPREVEDGDVERPAAEVVHGDALLRLALRTVGERRRRRLVQDAEHLQPGEAPRRLRRRALQIVEVRRHGDDRALDRLADRRFRHRLGLTQHEGADLGERVRLAARDHDRPAGRPLAQLERKLAACLLDRR
jgi:hypothetical protein